MKLNTATFKLNVAQSPRWIFLVNLMVWTTLLAYYL